MKTNHKYRKYIAPLLAATLLFAAIAASSLSTAERLNPRGRTGFALEASSGAEARWNSFVQVYDGTYSAQLTGSNGDTAKVNVGPVRMPLSRLSENLVTFWAYFEDNDASVPRVDLVLDNGIRLEGYRNTSPVSGTDEDIVDEADLGYHAASLWTQMKVQACPAAGSECGFYSSFAGQDPRIPDAWTISSPQNLATWAAQFPTASVVQVRIAYGDDAAGADYTVYVDTLYLRTTAYNLEPGFGGVAP